MWLKPHIWLKNLGLVGLCVLIGLSVNNAESADISLGVTSDWQPYIQITGPIEEGDLSRIIEKVEESTEAGARPRSLIITSPGGSVYEAMAIGRFANRLSLKCSAIFHQCDSACPIVLAGCSERAAHTSIGIHRPRFEKQRAAELTLKDANAAYEVMLADLRDYMEEMAIPEQLIEQMLRTPSDEMHLMPAEEFISLVGERSPAYDEWMVSRCDSISADERADLEILWKARTYQSWSEADQEGELTEAERRGLLELRRYYDQSQNFSRGYVAYLDDLRAELHECEDRARKAQAEEAEKEWEIIFSNR